MWSGHFPANCPVKISGSSGSNKRQATGPPTESMVRLEDAHVTFLDQHGHERHDVTMLDPGASAFLCGYGPFRRYLDYLKACNFPVETIEFNRCCRKFCFGGDGESWSHWVVRLPMSITGKHGRAQVVLIKGETPLLCGRPIIEALGLVIGFSQRKMRFQDGPWTSATLGYHGGEYLLPLWEPYDDDYPYYNPDLLHFDLLLAGDGEVDPTSVTMEQFDGEEHIFTSDDRAVVPEEVPDGSRPLQRHQLQTFDQKLHELHNDYHSYITSELHSSGKVIWEVYCGRARTSELADCMGAHIEIFSYETGWDFDLKSHRDEFLRRLDAEVPDELFMAPTCGPWSPMQNLAARSPEQQESLRELREWHHEIHLKFVKTAFLRQVRNGAHAHIEQPAHALSWKTLALKSLPGFHAVFDQCQYGCPCLDSDGVWKPTKKPTAIQTTKKYLFDQFNRRCPGDHQHCPLEGSAPGLGRRTQFMEDYQPGLSAVIAAALVFDEVPLVADYIGAVNEDRVAMTGIIQLLTTNKPEAVRTVQRLHRNLGHPDPSHLAELLESRGASTVVVETAKTYHCAACQRYRKLNSPAPSQLPTAETFNHIIQSDVLWLKLGDKKIPVLSMVDTATKYQAGAVIYGEKTSDFLHALERCWIRHFGCPSVLVTDEGRGWASDEMMSWAASHNVQHMISPEEAHTSRLSLVERRHQVLRKSLEVYMDDLQLTSVNGLREALAYTLPQINSTPSVAGYSPSQWAIGYQPGFPGDLLAEGLNPGHLDGTMSFEKHLEKRAAAKYALVKADVDRRLRRALLRRYAGTNTLLEPGQTCFYWRDARHGDLVIRFGGWALQKWSYVKMMNQESPCSTGFRMAPNFFDVPLTMSELIFEVPILWLVAWSKLDELWLIWSHVVSHGSLTSTVWTREASMTLTMMADDGEDLGVIEPPMRRHRSDAGGPSSGALDLDLGDDGDQEDYIQSLLCSSWWTCDCSYSPPAAVPPAVLPAVPTADAEIPDEDTIPTEPGEDTPLHTQADETEPGLEPSIPSSPTSTTRTRTPRAGPSEVPPLDPAVASLYERTENEDFAARRLRFDRQETLSYGPQPSRTTPAAAEPYTTSTSTSASMPTDAENVESYSQIFPVDGIDPAALPLGWTVDSEGYFQLSDQGVDFWEVRAGCLIPHHVRPRFALHKLKADSEIPIQPSLLDPVRVTVAKFPNGTVEIINGDSKIVKAFPKTWTGMTIYQITGTARRELCMFSNLPAKKVAKETRTKMIRTQKKVDKNGVNEKNLTLEQRALFQQAKQKELRSFFENEVWEFDSVQNSEAARTLTARMLLKWSKNEDGSLIVRGYADVDALQGSLETSSPTTTRLSRSYLLSLATMCGWKLWTSDISTAFLQGLPQERKLWVKLPAECLRLLGASEDTRMLLVKPVYGQLDAPRRWYLEAVHRLRSLGLRQHILDPCTFLIYETDHEDPYQPGVPRPAILGDDRLCGMICLHVDDMLGAGDPNSPVCTRMWSAVFSRSFPFVNGRMVRIWNTAAPTSRRSPMELFDYTTPTTSRRSSRWLWRSTLDLSLNSPTRRSQLFVGCWVLYSGLLFRVLPTCRPALQSTQGPWVVVWWKQPKRPIDFWSLPKTTPTLVWLMPPWIYGKSALSRHLMLRLVVDLMVPPKAALCWCWLLERSWRLKRATTTFWIGEVWSCLALRGVLWQLRLKQLLVLLMLLSLPAVTSSTWSLPPFLYVISWRWSRVWSRSSSPMRRPSLTAIIERALSLRWLIGGSAWRSGWWRNRWFLLEVLWGGCPPNVNWRTGSPKILLGSC